MSSKNVLRINETVETAPPVPESGRLRGRVPLHLRDPKLAASARRQAALDKVQAETEELLARARAEADSIVAEAIAESEVLRDQAREEGRDQGYREGSEAGYAEGLAAGRAELVEHLHTVYQLADAAANAKASVIASAESEIVELVIEVARKVIGELVELNPEVVIGIVANAIKHADTGDVMTIRVNPRDVELLREYWSEAVGDDPGTPSTAPSTGPSTSLRAEAPFDTAQGRPQAEGSGQRRRWEIVADRRVKPGGCVIDTQAGTVDARIDTQLVQIRYAFDKAKANEHND